MIEFIYNDFYIKNHEVIYYLFLCIMLLMFILTIFLVIKEVNKNANK